MPHAPHPAEPHRSAHLPLALVLGVVAGLVYVTFTINFVSNEARSLLTPTLTARQAAEAGVHKALYCLNATVGANCGGAGGSQYRGESGSVFGDASFVTTVMGSGHERIIESVGRVGKTSREVFTVTATDLPPHEAIDFAYSLQAGDGGVSLGQRAVVEGNVQSAGDLSCQPNSSIKGSVTVTKGGGVVEGCVIARDARADRLSKATVGGDAFYSATLASTAKVTGRRRPGEAVSAEVALPQLNLDLWTKAAAAGTVRDGDFRPIDGERLGPLMVHGDLVIGRSVSVRLDGPVWATGQIIVERGATVTLSEAFGRYGTVMLAYDPADPSAGRMLIEDGAVIKGSGTAGSLLLAVATATDASTAVMTVSGKPGDLFLLAPKGPVRLADRSAVLAAAARYLILGQRSSVARLPFSGPAVFATTPGGTWRIKE